MLRRGRARCGFFFFIVDDLVLPLCDSIVRHAATVVAGSEVGKAQIWMGGMGAKHYSRRRLSDRDQPARAK